jgi:hypothetical protein
MIKLKEDNHRSKKNVVGCIINDDCKWNKHDNHQATHKAQLNLVLIEAVHSIPLEDRRLSLDLPTLRLNFI